MSKLSRKTRLLIADAFKEALPYLSKTTSPVGQGQFFNICSCIYEAADHGKCARLIAHRATAIINTRLVTCMYFAGWLEKYGDVPWNDIQRDRYHHNGRKIQATRKAWLEDLIKEFSS